MEQRRFGNTDLVASAVGFGTWEMSTTMYGHIDVDEASKAVYMAIDRGITLFDTAEGYGPYLSEELLAKALGNRRQEIVLVTKVGFDYDDTPTMTGLNSSRNHIIARTEGCLRRLNTDYLDLLLIHWPDFDTPIEETMAGLEELQQSGKIPLLRSLQLRHRHDAGMRAARTHRRQPGRLSHVRPAHGVACAALVHG